MSVAPFNSPPNQSVSKPVHFEGSNWLVRWIFEKSNGHSVHYKKVDDWLNGWTDGWMDVVKSLCTKLQTMERGDFNNPPDQSVAPLKMDWLTNWLVRWIVERSNGHIKKCTKWMDGWMDGWVDVPRNEIEQRWHSNPSFFSKDDVQNNNSDECYLCFISFLGTSIHPSI